LVQTALSPARPGHGYGGRRWIRGGRPCNRCVRGTWRHRSL